MTFVWYKVGVRGFEPPASSSRTTRANRAALHPADGNITECRLRKQYYIQRSPAHRRSIAVIHLLLFVRFPFWPEAHTIRLLRSLVYGRFKCFPVHDIFPNDKITEVLTLFSFFGIKLKKGVKQRQDGVLICHLFVQNVESVSLVAGSQV